MASASRLPPLRSRAASHSHGSDADPRLSAPRPRRAVARPEAETSIQPRTSHNLDWFGTLRRQMQAEEPGYLLKSFLRFRRGDITVPRAMWHAFMDVEYRFHASAF